MCEGMHVSSLPHSIKLSIENQKLRWWYIHCAFFIPDKTLIYQEGMGVEETRRLLYFVSLHNITSMLHPPSALSCCCDHSHPVENPMVDQRFHQRTIHSFLIVVLYDVDSPRPRSPR